MGQRALDALVEQIRKAAFRDDGIVPSDGELLECYLVRGEDAAFECLVCRHAAMVLGVCRRVLGNQHDAEDAFQATFLVLARKGRSITRRQQVGNWLYGVAYRTAQHARRILNRQRTRETPMREGSEPAAAPRDEVNELLPLLDNALNLLPEKYRIAVVLCELECRSRKAVADQLGIPEGTLSSRLAKARRMLAKRLGRHAPTTSLAAVSALLAQTAAVPVPLFAAAANIRSAPTAKALVLAESVMRTMLLTKIKKVVLGLMVAPLLAWGGAILVVPEPGSAEADGVRDAPKETQTRQESKQPSRSDKPPQVTTDAERLTGKKEDAAAILEKAITAHGGLDAIEKYKTTRNKMKVILAGNDPKPKEWDWQFTAPNKLRQVREGYYLGKRKDSVWDTDGKSAWQIVDGTPRPVAGKLAQTFKDDVHLLHICRLTPLQGKDFALTRVDDIKINGKPALGLRVATKGQKDVTLFFDKDSGLLAKVERKTISPSNLEEVFEERFFQEFKMQDGLRLPRKILVNHDGKTSLQIEIVEAKLMK